MLYNESRWVMTLLWLAILAAAQILSLIPDPSPCLAYIEGYKTAYNDYEKHCAPLHVLAIWLLGYVGRLIIDNPDAVTAGATLVISGFTITLWWSTRKMWQASEKQIRAARRANRITRVNFENERRPWLSIEPEIAKLKIDGSLLNCEVLLNITNSGATPALHVIATVHLRKLGDPAIGGYLDQQRLQTANRTGGSAVAPNRALPRRLPCYPVAIDAGSAGGTQLGLHLSVFMTYTGLSQSEVWETVAYYWVLRDLPGARKENFTVAELAAGVDGAMLDGTGASMT